MTDAVNIDLNNVCESIRNGNKKERKNGIQLIISVLRWKSQIDEDSQSTVQDCVSAVTEIVTSNEIEIDAYPTVRFFRTVTSNDECFLRENDVSILLKWGAQSNIDNERYDIILKIVHTIAFNRPSALVVHRDELEEWYSHHGQLYRKQWLECELDIAAKLSSFDEVFMPLAVDLFTEMLESEPHSRPSRWTMRGVAINCLFVDHMEPEPEPWPVCFELHPVLSKISADDSQVRGRAKELLNYFLESFEISN